MEELHEYIDWQVKNGSILTAALTAAHEEHKKEFLELEQIQTFKDAI
jgi:hypothetical protein